MSNPFNEVRMGTVDVHIGKNGITSGLIEHITNILQKKKIIKIKVLREEAHEVTVNRIIATVLQQIKAVVLDVRGFTFILAKKPVPGVHLPKKYQNLETLLQSLTDQPLPLASSVKEDEDLEDFEDEDLDNEDLDQTDTKLKSSSDNDAENDNCEEGEAQNGSNMWILNNLTTLPNSNIINRYIPFKKKTISIMMMKNYWKNWTMKKIPFLRKNSKRF